MRLLVLLLLLATAPVSHAEHAAEPGLPSRPDAPLHRDFHRGLVAWLARGVEEPLRAAMPAASHATIPEILALVAEPAARPAPALLRSVREIRAGRMDLDPVLGIALALVEARVEGSGWAQVLLGTSAAKLAEERRLPAWRVLAHDAVLPIVTGWNNPQLADQHRDLALAALREALTAPADPAAERYLWWLWERAEYQRQAQLPLVGPIVADARQTHGADTWLGLMLDAALIEYRQASGTGRIRSVAGRLRAHQDIVAAYEAVLRRFPDRPEPALRVLRRMGGGVGATDEDDQEAWFRRAIAAEFDQPEAYRLILVSYQSGQGCPSCRRRLARACLDSGRFDTVVPLAYLALRGLESEHWHRTGAAPSLALTSETRRRDLARLFDGYRGTPLAADPRMRLIEAETRSLLGEHARAAELLATIEDDVDVLDRTLLTPLTRDGRPLALAREEAAARTAAGEAFARVDALLTEGDDAGAVAALAALIDGGATGTTRAFALRYGAAAQMRRRPSALHSSSPLADAVEAQQAPTVTWLLERGEPADAVDRKGRSALRIAVDADSQPVITLLIDRGADPNLADATGMTVLHHAAGLTSVPSHYPPQVLGHFTANRIKTLQLLLQRGAKASVADNSGKRPVHLALQRQWPEGVSALVAAGGMDGLTAEQTAELRKLAEAAPQAGGAILDKLSPEPAAGF